MSERKLARLTRLHRLLALLTGEIDAWGYVLTPSIDIAGWLKVGRSTLFRDLDYLETRGYIRRSNGFIQRGPTP